MGPRVKVEIHRAGVIIQFQLSNSKNKPKVISENTIQLPATTKPKMGIDKPYYEPRPYEPHIISPLKRSLQLLIIVTFFRSLILVIIVSLVISLQLVIIIASLV